MVVAIHVVVFVVVTVGVTVVVGFCHVNLNLKFGQNPASNNWHNVVVLIVFVFVKLQAKSLD